MNGRTSIHRVILILFIIIANGFAAHLQAQSEADRTEYPSQQPATSLFVMPTAYPMQSGEVHLGLYELFFASGSVGIANMVDVSAGTMLLPGQELRPYYAGIKVSALQSESGALAAGSVFTGDEDDDRLMFYAVGTLALFDGWLSAGYSSGSQYDGGLATMGVDYPISRSARIMSEFWISTDSDEALLNLGARFQLDFMSLDVGFVFPVSGDGGDYFEYLPWLGGTFIL